MSDEAKTPAEEIADLRKENADLRRHMSDSQQRILALEQGGIVRGFLRGLPRDTQQWVVCTILTVLSATLAHFGINVVLPPPPAWKQEQQQGRDALADQAEKEKPWTRPVDGWQHDPEAVDAVLQQVAIKTFSDTPAGKSDDPLPSSVYMWQAYTKLFARPPPSRDQGQVGSCVANGTNTAIERTSVVGIALKGEEFEFKEISREVTYAGSRVQIGKGRLGRSDGSVGAWAAQFVKDYGIVACAIHGKYDLTTYSVSRCREWGNSGVPADLIPLSKEHPVQSITLVKSWADAKKALAQGYGIAICSNVGFEGNRDANGVKAARGSWAHCMALDGYHIEGGKEYGHIENSWGPRGNEGPVGWGDPPSSGFWVASATIDRMLKQGDSWAFSTIKGFPAQKLDWFVLHHSPRRFDHALRLEFRPVARHHARRAA